MQRAYEEEQRKQNKVQVRSSSLWGRALHHLSFLTVKGVSSHWACTWETVFFTLCSIGWKVRSKNLILNTRRRKRGWGRKKRQRGRYLTPPEPVRRKGSVMRYRKLEKSLVLLLVVLLNTLIKECDWTRVFVERAISSCPDVAEKAGKSRYVQTFLCCEQTLLRNSKSVCKWMQIFTSRLFWCKCRI